MFTNMSEMMQFINTIKSGNPQQFVMNMLNERMSNDPMAQSLLKSIQSGDTKAIEQVARNIAKERGFDFDKEFNSFKQMFGL